LCFRSASRQQACSATVPRICERLSNAKKIKNSPQRPQGYAEFAEILRTSVLCEGDLPVDDGVPQPPFIAMT
jgi:hypothetical protein